MLASYVDLPRQRRSANPRRIQKVKPSKRRTLVSLHVARDSPLFAKVATTMTTTTTTTNTLVNRCATWLEQQFLSKCRSLPLPIIVQAMLLHRHVTPSSLNFFSVTTRFVVVVAQFSLHKIFQPNFQLQFLPPEILFSSPVPTDIQRSDSFKVHNNIYWLYISLNSFNPLQFYL